MTGQKPIIAFMYDFDRTLCTKDMQEYTFIPHLGMSAESFWAQSNAMAKEQKMDSILAYMYLMIKKSSARNLPIRRTDFVGMGRDIEFFPGVPEWFQRLNQYGKGHGVRIEHYIISSGLKEIIEGSKIKDEFKEIYACEFHYDANGAADWPLLSVNYTGKTQFLFRINKGVLDISDDDTLNQYIPEDKRRVPFRNMVYIGDGLTDVPCMKLVKTHGGQSIAVYQEGKKELARDLLTHGRVNFIAPADYSDDTELDSIAKQIIDQMAATNRLTELRKKQNTFFTR